MKFKHLLCSALSVALISTTALAAKPVVELPASKPMTIDQPLAAEAETVASTYTITQRHNTPIMVWGRATGLKEEKIFLENRDETVAYPSIILNVTEETLILDAVTGGKKSFADLKEGETIYAYTSPLMTRSMPPISNVELVLCNLPADFAAPSFAEIQAITTSTKEGEDNITITTDRDVILHLSAETELLTAPGMEENISLADLKPGTQVLAWYQMVALSFPAQASPTKLMVFPYSYGGTLSADQAGVTINSKPLELTAAELPHAVDGKLMLPMRKVAEGLGCQVVWAASNPNGVTIQQDGQERYRLTLNQDTVVTDGETELLLSAPVSVIGGVTFLSADDVIALHGLKLVGGYTQEG